MNEMLGTEKVKHDFSKKHHVEEAVIDNIEEPTKHTIEYTVHESETVNARP
jgi:hypothetical protein